MSDQQESNNKTGRRISSSVYVLSSILSLVILGLVIAVFSITMLTKQVNVLTQELEKSRAARSKLELKLAEFSTSVAVDESVVKWCYKGAKNYVPRTEIEDIVAASRQYKHYLMLLSVFKEESGFDRYARSEMSAKGLGQIRSKFDAPPNTWSGWLDEMVEAGIWDEEIDVFDIYKNIAGTNYILNKYYAETKDWRATLLKYVNGDEAYVTRVLSNFAELTLLLAEENDAGNTEVSDKNEGLGDSSPVAADESGHKSS